MAVDYPTASFRPVPRAIPHNGTFFCEVVCGPVGYVIAAVYSVWDTRRKEAEMRFGWRSPLFLFSVHRLGHLFEFRK